MVSRRVTVTEYLAIPEEAPYLEYLHGEVVEKPGSGFRRMVVTNHLIVELHRYEATHGGISGPEARVEFQIEGGTYFRLPDVAYWAPGRQVEGERAMRPPTLAAEVSSPGQSIAALREKCRQFRSAGVDVCWLFDLDRRTAEVFEGVQDGAAQTTGRLESSALPGFTLSLDALFALLDR
jgi:Uma2 family endonuclease